MSAVKTAGLNFDFLCKLWGQNRRKSGFCGAKNKMATVAIKMKISCVRPTLPGVRIPFEPPGISYILNIQTYNAQAPGKSGLFIYNSSMVYRKFLENGK